MQGYDINRLYTYYNTWNAADLEKEIHQTKAEIFRRIDRNQKKEELVNNYVAMMMVRKDRPTGFSGTAEERIMYPGLFSEEEIKEDLRKAYAERGVNPGQYSTNRTYSPPPPQAPVQGQKSYTPYTGGGSGTSWKAILGVIILIFFIIRIIALFARMAQ